MKSRLHSYILLVVTAILILGASQVTFSQSKWSAGFLLGGTHNSIQVKEEMGLDDKKGSVGLSVGMLATRSIPLSTGLDFLKFEAILTFNSNSFDTKTSTDDRVEVKQKKLDLKPVFSFDIGSGDIKPRFSLGFDVGVNFGDNVKVGDTNVDSIKSAISANGIVGIGFTIYQRFVVFGRYHYRILPNDESSRSTSTTTTIEWNPSEFSFGAAFLFLK